MDWKRSDLHRTYFGEDQLILICARCSWIMLAGSYTVTLLKLNFGKGKYMNID